MAHRRSTSERKIIQRSRDKASKEQEHHCFWCNCKMVKSVQPGRSNPPNIRTGDHVIPLSKGGQNIPENIVAACQQCNWDKGAEMPTFAEILSAVTALRLKIGDGHNKYINGEAAKTQKAKITTKAP